MGYILDSIKALFTKNTTNAASVSGARVPIMSADGTPIGNDSLANLASVLGGIVEYISQRDYNLNNAPTDHIICSDSGDVSSSLVNAPISIRSNFLCRTFSIGGGGYYRLQVYKAFSGSSNVLRIFARSSYTGTGGVLTWTNWIEIQTTSV